MARATPGQTEIDGEIYLVKDVNLPNWLRSRVDKFACSGQKRLPISRVLHGFLYPEDGESPFDRLDQVKPVFYIVGHGKSTDILVDELDHLDVLDEAKKRKITASSIYAGIFAAALPAEIETYQQ
jgi:hypothetical protein